MKSELLQNVFFPLHKLVHFKVYKWQLELCEVRGYVSGVEGQSIVGCCDMLTGKWLPGNYL